MLQIYILLAILCMTLFLFLWSGWRYDIIALFALMVAVLSGIVPFNQAFTGLANPAVITVACVMVMTSAITQSGILDHIIKRLTPITTHQIWHLATLTIITAIFSAFINNVGALALMMPVAIETSIKSKRSPSLVLMPIAFGSVLGGLVTAIGTPPNLLISAYREQLTGHAFSMFDFAPVGSVTAVIGILFIILLGWRLLPSRKVPENSEDLFQIQDYITEVVVSENSLVANKPLKDLENLIEGDFLVVGLIRKKRKRLVIPSDEILQVNDILIIEANHNDLEKLIHAGKLELVTGDLILSDVLQSDKIGLMEAVIPQGSRVEGRSSQKIRLKSRHNMNLVAIAREGNPFRKRLNHVNFRAGDVVLLQGSTLSLQEKVVSLGMLPLVERGVQVGLPRKAFLPTFIFLIAIVIASFQIVPVQIAFALAVGCLVIFNIIPARKLYDTIDWPIILLLAAMIPIGESLQTTGTTELIAHAVTFISDGSAPLILALIFVITMTLSDLINNAATAVIMAPIAATIAQNMGMSIDPFLMTVAISASCSFLTPISHQNNTLVMGPGGYKFFDYFRMGLPLEILILVTTLPMILWIWPV